MTAWTSQSLDFRPTPIRQTPETFTKATPQPPLIPRQFRRSGNRWQRGKVLERFVFHEGAYLLALDGTGYFSSPTIHCASCLEKVNSKTGEVTYSHQLLGASIVHPNLREVIPLAPEPIIKQDGSTKNDCERNATKRLLPMPTGTRSGSFRG